MATKVPKRKDIWALCIKHGLKKFTRKYYDAAPDTEYRLLDSVGAVLIEVNAWVLEDSWGTPSGIDVKINTDKWRRIDVMKPEHLAKVDTALAAAVKKCTAKLTAKPADDKAVWKWLDRNMVLDKSDLKYGRVSYTCDKTFMLMHAPESNLCWTPLIDGSESRDIAGSSSAPLGEIGFNRVTFAAWLEKQGIHKQKKERY